MILCRNIVNAKDIINVIFTIALSETDDNLKNGNPVQCDEIRIKLINLITSNELKLEDFEIDNSANCKYEIEIISNVDYLNPFENSWIT